MATKSVLISGCSVGGIGSGLAEAFQKRGLQVFATARTASKMSHLENLPNVTLITLDVTSPSSITDALKVVEAKTGGALDYLVNNSGLGYVMPTLDLDIAQGKRLFDVNFWGALAVIQAFAPLVIAARGSIVNISSVGGHVSPPFMSAYTSSKAAMTSASDSLRLEMAPFGVKVVTVMTGTVDSRFFDNSPEYKLPSTSRYMPMEKTIARTAQGEDLGSKMETAVFADTVVADLLGGANGKIWRGKTSSLVRILWSFFPTFYLDKLLLERYGLDKFATRLGSKA